MRLSICRMCTRMYSLDSDAEPAHTKVTYTPYRYTVLSAIDFQMPVPTRVWIACSHLVQMLKQFVRLCQEDLLRNLLAHPVPSEPVRVQCHPRSLEGFLQVVCWRLQRELLSHDVALSHPLI